MTRPPNPLKQGTRFVERQTRKSPAHSAWIPIPQVAKEIRLDVSLGEEFLVAPETRLAGSKERLIHLGLIEARHRSAIEAERTGGDDQVSALEAGVPLGRCFDHLGAVRK